ncbi:metal-dependent hydrolase [Microbacterium sp. HD4P20]|uniref:metal-dependent hydrolase n=1 Tax=Microbacterium sp. HD4P20 TaxID=2864874 RepID=UPI001C63BE99|nr:metal-dependent hydrolase [Microbacterium sp. HD4P20]MCP2637435.1 metal-dependent hydrolase [Microbacterium sp. HD4P20]
MIPATVVTYPGGATTSRGTVLHVADAGDGRTAVVLDTTAFHPVDTAWPDQPADRGALVAGSVEIPVVDAVVGAVRDGELLIGRDVPVRTGTPGWTFVVAHVVDGNPVAAGDELEVRADAAFRGELSAGHTGCHLAALALDAALAGAWRKDVPVDALGAPGFDALAIQESRILPLGSRDVYRIGKSLRRKGFDPAALDDLDGLAAGVNGRLAEWIATGAPVRIEPDGDTLADRRTWVCELPGTAARIPCGGTHVASLGDLDAVTVAFTSTAVDGAVELVMTTMVTRA